MPPPGRGLPRGLLSNTAAKNLANVADELRKIEQASRKLTSQLTKQTKAQTSLNTATTAATEAAKKRESAGNRRSWWKDSAAAAGATVGGLATAGFRNTIEGNRLQLELSLVSREIAGAFKPAIDLATKGLTELRKRLEHLGPRGQNALMAGGLALGAFGLMRMGGAVLRGMGVIGGGAAGAAAAGAGGAAGTAAAAAGGGILAGGKAFLKRLPAIGLGIGLAEEATNPDGHFERLKRKGRSDFAAGLGAIGGVGLDLLTFGRFSRRLRERGELGGDGGGPNPDRRAVTLADSGFEAPGSAFERMTNRLNLVEAEGTGAPGTIGAVASTLEGIKGILEAALDKLGAPALGRRPG